MQIHLPRIAATLMLPLLVAVGCSSVSDPGDERPETARVLLEGSAPVPLEVVASTNFTQSTTNDGETVVTLHASDTLEATPPFDQSWQMTGTNVGFYVQVRNPDTQVADIRLRVFIDGNERYDQLAEMSDDASLAWVFIASQ